MNSSTLFLKSVKRNEHNQQQQNNVPHVVKFFVYAVVENSGVIFLEETQPRKRNSLCTE